MRRRPRTRLARARYAVPDCPFVTRHKFCPLHTTHRGEARMTTPYTPRRRELQYPRLDPADRPDPAVIAEQWAAVAASIGSAPGWSNTVRTCRRGCHRTRLSSGSRQPYRIES